VILSIDYDGTLVEHRFPAIGPEVPDAFKWLRAFQEAGIRLILSTMRSDGPEGPMLTNAVDFCRERGIEFWGVNVNPDQAEWTSSPKVYHRGASLARSSWCCPTRADCSRAN
jgi:hypothetical protein